MPKSSGPAFGLPRILCEGVAMGRGRAKAKQQKVARELKYYSPETDLEALQRELAGNGRRSDDAADPHAGNVADEEDDEADDTSRSRR
jgi:hypothetical protein